MEQANMITGITNEDIRTQLRNDFFANSLLGNYEVTIEQEGREVTLRTGSSQGGSFEGGYEFTNISAPITVRDNFRLAIYPQDFLAEIVKFFGAEDMITGYKEFDDSVMVKTNDALRCHTIFADAESRLVFQTLSGYSLEIKHEDDHSLLELDIQAAITNPEELVNIYHAFFLVLKAIG